MEQLPRLKARLSSLHDLRDLIRALRALAASHLQDALAALDGVRAYVEVVEDAIAAGASLIPERAALAQDQADHDGVTIVVCSEHGFVGDFNERLLDAATGAVGPGGRLVVVGRRGATQALERETAVAEDFPMATRVGGILGISRRVAARLATAGRARIVYGSHRRGGGAAEVVSKRILPLDPALLTRTTQAGPPLHHLSAEALLEHLANEYLFAEIASAVMESLASENGARLKVMEAADGNIADKLSLLQRQVQTLRQEEITTELLDVVIGSEAILQAG